MQPLVDYNLLKQKVSMFLSNHLTSELKSWWSTIQRNILHIQYYYNSLLIDGLSACLLELEVVSQSHKTTEKERKHRETKEVKSLL